MLTSDHPCAGTMGRVQIQRERINHKSRPPPSRYDLVRCIRWSSAMLVFLTTLLHLNHGTPFFCFGLEQQTSYSSESAVVPEHSIWRDSRGEAESAHHPMRCLRSSCVS